MHSAKPPNCIALIPSRELSHLSCCFVKYFPEELWLVNNELEGTIPSEVGALTKLCEYTQLA
jgi:hypothetical protein